MWLLRDDDVVIAASEYKDVLSTIRRTFHLDSAEITEVPSYIRTDVQGIDGKEAWHIALNAERGRLLYTSRVSDLQMAGLKWWLGEETKVIWNKDGVFHCYCFAPSERKALVIARRIFRGENYE